MKISGQIIESKFIKRLNKYLGIIELDSKNQFCFIPNPGRLRDILIPDKKVFILRNERPTRKTVYDLISVYHNNIIVSIDSRITNQIFLESIKEKSISNFDYDQIIPEYNIYDSRIDFLLTKDSDKCLVEVKSCTLVVEDIASFPDAPTRRGRKHLYDLIAAKENGFRSCIVFIIQREDAKIFKANKEIDPEFSKILKIASKKGVEIYAYNCAVDIDKINIKNSIDIMI